MCVADVDDDAVIGSSVNCSLLDSSSGQRLAVLRLVCHGGGGGGRDVIAVTSLCGGFLRESRQCPCCTDETADCRVAVEPDDATLGLLNRTCSGLRSCYIKLRQPSVTHCFRHDVTSADYVIALYRCVPPITAGQ